MRILLLNQFFYPDLAPTSQLLTGLASKLAHDGHSVTVICGSPSYTPASAGGALAGIKTEAAPALRFSRGIIGRMQSYLWFFLFALWRALQLPKPDIVVSMTTPPLISIVGSVLKIIKGSKHFIWEMDVYPEIVVDLGYLKPTSLIVRVLSWLAHRQRQGADGVIALGECMKVRLAARGLSSKKIHVAHNWADGDVFYPRAEHLHKPVSIIYPGNFGLGHDERTLTAALYSIEADSRIEITFVGGGPRYKRLKAHCEQHRHVSVVFEPYCSPEELADTKLPRANVGLILQDVNCSGSVVPSKLYPMIAARLPILFIGPQSATPARIIEQFNCGWFIEAGNSIALIDLLKHLADHPEEIYARGCHARQAFLKHFDRPIALARIMEILGLPKKRVPDPTLSGQSTFAAESSDPEVLLSHL